MVKKYNKNDIIILGNNCALTVTKEKENNVYDVVISNGKTPLKLMYVFNISGSDISIITEKSKEYVKAESNIIDILKTFFDNIIFSPHTKVEYLEEEYRFVNFYSTDSDSHIELEKIITSGRNSYRYTISMTKEEFIEANMKNPKNLSYFVRDEIFPKVVDFQEIVEKNQLQDKKTFDEVRKSNEDVFENIIEDIIENPKYDFPTSHKEIIKNKINNYQEMEKKYMDTIISKCDEAITILESDEGTELFNKTIEFFKTLSPNEKISWSRDLRMKMDLIISNEEETNEIDSETVENILTSIKKDFYIVRK